MLTRPPFSLAVKYLFLTNEGDLENSQLVLEPFNANHEQNDYEVCCNILRLRLPYNCALHRFHGLFAISSQIREYQTISRTKLRSFETHLRNGTLRHRYCETSSGNSNRLQGYRASSGLWGMGQLIAQQPVNYNLTNVQQLRRRVSSRECMNHHARNSKLVRAAE